MVNRPQWRSARRESVLVAVFAILGAPGIQARLGIARALYLSLALFAIDVLVIGVFIDSRTAVIAAVILSGVFIGTNNTITTQAVMTVAPVPRPIASEALELVPEPLDAEADLVAA